MFSKRPILMICLLTLGVLATTLAPTTAVAKPFKKTKTMELRYGWGTCDLDEFDMYEAMYGSLPSALITFYNDGTFDAIDTTYGSTGGGVYDKQGRQLVITITPDGPWGTVEYVGSRVAPGEYAGEIQVDGVVWGHWRGEF